MPNGAWRAPPVPALATLGEGGLPQVAAQASQRPGLAEPASGLAAQRQ